MKSFFDWLKDLVYDSIDYIIMILIIVSVVFVIGWRLDVLFANDATDIPPKDNIIIVDGNSQNLDKQTDDNASNDDSAKENDQLDYTQNPVNDNPDSVDVTPEPPKVDKPADNPEIRSVNITIPPGSLPSKIGSILETGGLVTNKNDFVKKAQELKLDTKLKSGTFKIPTKSSIEEILKIITK